MGIFEDYRFKNIRQILSIMDMILVIMISIVHFVFYFLVKESDFGNIFDTYDSSPLFDFNVDINCGIKSHIIFHVWEGREETEYYYYDGQIRSRTKILDKANIDMINGNYFCYEEKASYKTLLYNGQIIKKEKKCGDKYPKDCGTIDTLNQHLCIKSNEKCPLYDVGIGIEKIKDSSGYSINQDADIYYNNEEYNEPNKKIIGKIILNDGQPCYRLNEQLWKKFDSDEVGEEDLKCDLEIFGEFTDNRYDNKGSITYHKLYEDNLSTESQDLLFDDIGDESVSLFTREFLGIDKVCDEKNGLSKEVYNKLTNNQQNESTCLLVEVIILFCFLIMVPCMLCCSKNNSGSDTFFIITFIMCFLTIFVCAICQAVFLGRIIANDLSYDCSDYRTNEVLRKENQNTKKSIIYTAVNLGLDSSLILINILSLIICKIINVCEDMETCCCICFQRKARNQDNFKYSEKYGIYSAREVVVDNRTPVVNNTTPVVDNRTPVIDNRTPVVDNNRIPVVDNTTLVVDNNRIPVVDNTTPVLDNRPPINDEQFDKPKADNNPAPNPVAEFGYPPIEYPPPNSDTKL